MIPLGIVASGYRRNSLPELPVTPNLLHFDATEFEGMQDGAGVPSWTDLANGYDLQPEHGSVTWDAAERGVYFDGASSLLALDKPLFNNEVQGISFIVLKQESQGGSNSTIMSLDKNVQGYQRFLIGSLATSGYLRFGVRRQDADGLANVSSTTPIPLGQRVLLRNRKNWYFPGSAEGQYLNGAKIADAPTTTTGFTSPTDSSAIRLGAVHNSGNGGSWFSGHIHEVLLYSSPLTPEETVQIEDYLTAKWLSPSDPILDYWFSFEGGTPGEAVSLNPPTGVPFDSVSGLVFNSDAKNGLVGGSGVDLADGYAQWNLSTPQAQHSVGFWAKAGGTEEGRLMDFRSTPTSGTVCGVLVSTAGNIRMMQGSSGSTFGQSPPVDRDKWYWIAYTVDMGTGQSTLNVYDENGYLWHTGSFTMTPPYSECRTARFGRIFGTNTSGFNIDDIQWKPGSLTDLLPWMGG